MRILLIPISLLVITCCADRSPIPYNTYVKLGGLPLPLSLREKQHKLYTDEDARNSTRIVGGQPAVAGEGAWTVSLSLLGLFHMCGGSVYTPSTIITAAHCLDGYSASTFRIRAGSLSSSGGTLVNVARLIPNAGYNPQTIDNDIGLMILSSPLPVDGVTIKSVSLPPIGYEPEDGDSVTVYGWGALTEGGSSPSTLYKVEVPIVGRAKCEAAYGASEITNNMICAGVPEGGKDACQGDSGGPLVHEVNGLGILDGIVSWGNGCARPDYPGVYTRVSNYNTWINVNAAP